MHSHTYYHEIIVRNVWTIIITIIKNDIRKLLNITNNLVINELNQTDEVILIFNFSNIGL